MAQKFKDIQVSNKGMIKLIRENGNDYIFPASKITSVGYREKKTTDLLMKRGVGSL